MSEILGGSSSSLVKTLLGGLHISSELAEIAEFFMMLIGVHDVKHAEAGDARREAVLQHLPRLFGFGNRDETLLASLRTGLKKNYRVALDKIMCKLPLDDAIAFIINVGSMPNEVKVDKDGNKDSVQEFSKDDRRIKFLQILVEDANMCATDPDIEGAIKSLRANRLLDRSSFSTIHKEIEGVILGLLRIKSWDELTTQKLADAFESIADDIERFNANRRKGSFHGQCKRIFAFPFLALLVIPKLLLRGAIKLGALAKIKFKSI